MANKHLLAALLVVADVLGCVAIVTFLQPCPFPAGDGDSSDSPSLVPGATDPGFLCLPISTYAVLGVDFLLGILIGFATVIILEFLFADDIMRYFTIRGDPEAGGKIQVLV